MNIEIVLERIKQLLEEHGDTPADLARKANLNKTTVYRWVKGDISSMKTATLLNIAHAYNINIGWLIGLDEPKEIEHEEHARLRKEIQSKLFNVSIEDLKKVNAMLEIFIKGK
jgi:transcriptional regulator with XRE-family HTH domain